MERKPCLCVLTMPVRKNADGWDARILAFARTGTGRPPLGDSPGRSSRREDSLMASEDPNPLEELLNRAGRAAQPRHPGWKDLPDRLQHTPQLPARSRWRWWWLAPAPL